MNEAETKLLTEGDVIAPGEVAVEERGLDNYAHTILRLTLEGWETHEIAAALGARSVSVKLVKDKPAFRLQYAILRKAAENRAVTVAKRIEALSHQALDVDARILGMDVDAANPQVLAIIARKSDEIKDRHGEMPKKVAKDVEHRVFKLDDTQIAEINAEADAIEVEGVDVGELIDSNPLEDLYDDAQHLLEPVTGGDPRAERAESAASGDE